MTGWIHESAQALAARLTAAGLPTEPRVVPGGHETSTWRALAPLMLEALFER